MPIFSEYFLTLSIGFGYNLQTMLIECRRMPIILIWRKKGKRCYLSCFKHISLKKDSVKRFTVSVNAWRLLTVVMYWQEEGWRAERGCRHNKSYNKSFALRLLRNSVCNGSKKNFGAASFAWLNRRFFVEKVLFPKAQQGI